MREIFKFSGDILIQKMHSSGILRFNDSVNDMTFFSKFKYTSKGPNALGNSNSNNIGIKYRDIHPSHLGYLDLLVCGNSDPGTSGLLSPFSDIKGLYFDNSIETDGFYYNLTQDLKKKAKKNHKIFINLEYGDKEEYYNALSSLTKYANDNISISGTSKEGTYEIVMNNIIDIDSSDAPSIEPEAKKKTNAEREAEKKRKKQK